MKKMIILLMFIATSVATIFAPKGTSYAEISNPFVEVSFNSNGGTAVESQLVRIGEKIEKPDAPIDRLATDIFAGWYYLENGIEKAWDFNNNVTNNLSLYAKWSNLECLDYSVLSQTLENLKPVHFYIETTESVVWYVNGQRQYGVSGKEFVFYMPESGSYVVNCRVAGVLSKQYVVAVDYYIPQELNVVMEISANNLYTFEIQNGEYMNADNCTWYCAVDNENATPIGTGVKCIQKISKNCKVFAVYYEDTMGAPIFSRNLIIEPEFTAPTTAYILIGAMVVVLSIIVAFVIISKKKYKDYY